MTIQNKTIELDSGIYRISSDGKVFSQSKLKIPLVTTGMKHTGEFKVILKPERELTYTLNVRGYITVGFAKKTHMVHRLVAQAFIQNPDNKPFVNHIDGNKLNNDVDNLEWVTHQENIQHSFDCGHRCPIGLMKSMKNLKDTSKLTDEQVRYVRRVHIPRSKDFSATALSAQFGTSVAAMSKIIKGVSYPHVT